MTTNPHNVQPGQVWEDNDWRATGRQLLIVRVEGTHAEAKVIRDADNSFLGSVGKATRIKLTRFKPTSTGYRLIEDVKP